MLNVSILSRDYAEYVQQIECLDTELITIGQATSDPSEVDCTAVSILLSEPDLAVQVIQQCTNMQWLQSTWAGNAPLIKHPKRDYCLTATQGIFADAMREYVFAHILFFSRNMAAFEQKQWCQPSVQSLRHKTLGIMGAGDIASGLLGTAHQFGMRVIGLNRSGYSSQPYEAIYSPTQKYEFAQQVDYLVSLLPDTRETENCIDQAFIEQLPNHCVLINAGRGQSIDDDALIHALKHKTIKAAVLDVFKQEPLPLSHPYWQLPNVIITQHTAAISDPQQVFAVFTQNCQRWQQGQALNYQIDFNRGY